jgi:hypothetical protein
MVPLAAAMYTLTEADSDHIKGVVGNMLFMVWVSRTEYACYRRGAEIVRMLGPRFPTGIGVLNLVEVSAVPPDARARGEFAQFLKLPEIRHFSVTHEGHGFKAAAVRAIVSAAQFIAAPPFPHSVHATVDAAAAWHSDQQRALGIELPAREVTEIVADLRRRHFERFGDQSD